MAARKPQGTWAEDLPYWNTGGSLSGNQERIERLLRDFQARAVEFTMGWNQEQCIWRIRFEWRSRIYRFDYMPWPCRLSGPVNKRPRQEAQMNQMGSRAYNEIKALLTAAAFDVGREVPRAMFGFLELPGKSTSGIAPRASDFTPEALVQRLELPALAANNPADGEFTEVSP